MTLFFTGIRRTRSAELARRALDATQAADAGAQKIESTE